MIGELGLTADEYAQWVDWTNPLTGESMGKPRLPGEDRRGSPRYAEMVVNAPKSLSIAAALHPDVSKAVDAAQRDAVAEIRSWLGQHSVTRVGPRGKQEVVPVEQLETVAVSHKTSRAGDPHRHIHFQIVTRVWAAGAWRGLDTAALFRQQGAIRALGTAVIAAHPQLAAVLDAHGLTLDPVTGEVAELQPYNAVMSKRGEQVARNLAKFEAEWRTAHPGQEPGPVAMSRLIAMAWDHERPHKKPTVLGHEAAWRAELDAAGYRPDPARVPVRAAVSLDELRVQQVASRALDRCAAGASTWTVHDIHEQVTRIITAAGVRATPEELVSDVMAALGVAVTEYAPAGSPVIVPTPAYMPFLTYLPTVGHPVVEVPGVTGEDGRWHHDIERIDEAFAAGARTLVLCNPHNPTGTVIDRDELLALAEIVDRHGGRVFADEIHAPLRYDGRRHIPYASLSETTAAHTVTGTSASKAWNIPGLKTAQLILSSEVDQEAYRRFGFAVQHGAATLGVVASTAAYREGKPWLEGVLTYLDAARHDIDRLVTEHLPGAVYRVPEATYIGWIDVSALEIPGPPAAFFRERAGVVLTEGALLGRGYESHVRLVFATPRPVLAEAIERMGDAVQRERAGRS